DRQLFGRIQALDRPTLEREIGDLMEPGTIDSLLQRRDRIVKKFKELIAKQGRSSRPGPVTALTSAQGKTMTTTYTTRCALILLAIAAFPLVARAQTFPKTLAATTEVSGATGRLTGSMTIQVDRLMEELDFKKVSDALKIN